MRILPPKQKLIKFLEVSDFFLWEYYDEGFLGGILAWIFRSRIKVLLKFLKRIQLEPRMIMDVGCGPMFISYSLAGDSLSEYVGVDIMPADRLRKYRDVMRNIDVEKVEAVRASAEQLPFIGETFDFVLSLDVLEHLKKPTEAVMEISRVVKYDGAVAVSLPLENSTQKLLRIGFIFMKIAGDPILKRAKHIPITRTPKYHYKGDMKSYDDMVKVLTHFLNFTDSKYTPIGLHRSINVNAVHLAQKKP